MAVKQIMIDDLDGSEGAATIDFSLEGVGYSIDLNRANADALRKALAPYIDAGRRSSVKKSSKKPAAHKPAAEVTANNDAIREWARKDGRFGKVADRGRIPKEIMNAFEEAHAPSASVSMFSAAGAK